MVSKGGIPPNSPLPLPSCTLTYPRRRRQVPRSTACPSQLQLPYKTGLAVMWKLTLRWWLPQFLACLGVATEMVLPVAISVIATRRRLTDCLLWCRSTGSRTKYWDCWLTLGLIYGSPKCQGTKTLPPPCSDSLLDTPCRNIAGLTSRETLVCSALFLLWKSPHIQQTQEGKILILQNYESDPCLV